MSPQQLLPTHGRLRLNNHGPEQSKGSCVAQRVGCARCHRPHCQIWRNLQLICPRSGFASFKIPHGHKDSPRPKAWHDTKHASGLGRRVLTTQGSNEYQCLWLPRNQMRKKRWSRTDTSIRAIIMHRRSGSARSRTQKAERSKQARQNSVRVQASAADQCARADGRHHESPCRRSGSRHAACASGHVSWALLASSTRTAPPCMHAGTAARVASWPGVRTLPCTQGSSLWTLCTLRRAHCTPSPPGVAEPVLPPAVFRWPCASLLWNARSLLHTDVPRADPFETRAYTFQTRGGAGWLAPVPVALIVAALLMRQALIASQVIMMEHWTKGIAAGTCLLASKTRLGVLWTAAIFSVDLVITCCPLLCSARIEIIVLQYEKIRDKMHEHEWSHLEHAYVFYIPWLPLFHHLNTFNGACKIYLTFTLHHVFNSLFNWDLTTPSRL
jgi:hypothetical protein